MAWLTNKQNLTEIVFWDDANSNALPSNTTLGKAIWRITKRVGTGYDRNEVKYYSYKYPAADRLLIGGRVTITGGGETYYFLIPSTNNTVYDAKFLWTAYLYGDSYGRIKINTADIYEKSGYGYPLEYARYYQNITDIPRDTRHTIYMQCGYYGSCILKSATAMLYKSG